MASLEALAAAHAQFGHLQEVILQNYVPHRRYYGEEPAEIATEAAEAYWRTGVGAPPELERPAWAARRAGRHTGRRVGQGGGARSPAGGRVPPPHPPCGPAARC